MTPEQTAEAAGIDLEAARKRLAGINLNANVAQPEERRTRNAEVVGSSPAVGSKPPRKTRSDKGTKKPAKVEQAGALDYQQVAHLDALDEDVWMARMALENAQHSLDKAMADRRAFLNLLQGK